jgi:outer membrane lipoprotein-sorting protein
VGALMVAVASAGPASAQGGPLPAPPKSTAQPPLSLTPAAKPNLAVAARAGGVAALDANQRALVDRVSAYLSGVQTLVGDFVQVGPDGGRTAGKFYIQKPGKVRFEYDPPSVIELIADGQSVAIRDRKLATQDLLLLSQTPLRFLLLDRINLMRDTNVVGVQADKEFVTVMVEEKQLIGGTYRLLLMFGAQDLTLKQWTVTDPQGYDTTVAVYNLDTASKPDPKLFKINYERMIQ